MRQTITAASHVLKNVVSTQKAMETASSKTRNTASSKKCQ